LTTAGIEDGKPGAVAIGQVGLDLVEDGTWRCGERRHDLFGSGQLRQRINDDQHMTCQHARYMKGAAQ
jgi:hypothetical protein